MKTWVMHATPFSLLSASLRISSPSQAFVVGYSYLDIAPLLSATGACCAYAAIW